MRNLVLLIGAVLWTLIVWPMAQADKTADRTQQGRVVKAGEGKLTITTTQPSTHTFLVPATARILCDGKESRLEDLKPGTTVRVTMKGDGDRAVILVEAKTEQK
jgi:hypothetical protein